MKNNKLQIAIIGCGTIATMEHIPCYMNNDDCEIKYFCDIIKERADNAVKEYNCGTAVYDYHEILNDPELDAVSVCTPNNMHPTISIDFLRAGKNVLCEKPVARTYAEALEMQKVQHETQKVLNIGVVNRFNQNVNKIKELIESGALGDVYHVYISFRAHRAIPGIGGQFTTKEISGGGVLIDWGVHYLDLVLHCIGEPEILSVSGKAHSKIGKDMKNYVYDFMWADHTKNIETGIYDVEDSVTAFIRTEGPTITLNGTWAQNIKYDDKFIDFLGDKAGIRLNYCGDFTMWGSADGQITKKNINIDTYDMFENEIDSFLRCIRTGEKLPSHIDHVIQTAKLMQTIYDSSDLGREITLQ